MRVAIKETWRGEDLLPWLMRTGFEIHRVNGVIEIEALPKGMELRGEGWSPVIVTATGDIVADIDPETGGMSVRDKYWYGE